MGRINKSNEGMTDIIKPLTLIVSADLWNKFKIITAAKGMTLNDYLVELIRGEVNSKSEAIKALQSSAVDI